MDKRKKRKILIVVAAVAVFAVGITVWRKFYRDLPQPLWITADRSNDFLYGAVGAEETPGLPYWIWLALPRLFPEYMPGPGGYASLGLSWEESREMPVGFAKKTVGYVRVTGNCALCHAAAHSAGPDDLPTVVTAAPDHATDIQGLLYFFTQCAQDTRFNADEILAEVDTATKLSFLDRLLYRYVLIPRTKRALLNPGPVIFSPALQLHTRDPHSAFTQKRMMDLGAWLNAQRH
jgi:hypothetical protein